MAHMTTVVKIGNKYEQSGFCPYCKYDDAHKKHVESCPECQKMSKEDLGKEREYQFGRWMHRFFANEGSKEHTNEVKMYTTHARGGEHKEQIHNLRSSLLSGKPKKLRDWGKGRPKKAVMAVSAPKEGETCNCNQGDNKGDHSNANGDMHGMYNQEGGRANWQGQGLPQPKDTCQCDEKPAEADKVPNADARISDKEMKKPKKKGGFQLNYDDWNEGKDAKKKKKKIKKMTPKQREARDERVLNPKPLKHTDLRRRKYRDKKRQLYIGDLDDTGHPKKIEGELEVGREKKRKRRAQERRDIKAYMKYGDGRWGIPYKKIKALEDIIKKHRPELFIGDLDEEGKLPDHKRLLNIVAAKRQKRKGKEEHKNEET